MTLFLTGCNSFIGHEVMRLAALRGIDCTGIDSAPSSGGVIGDIRDCDLADAIPQSVDAVIHLAALSRDADCRGKLQDTMDVNLMGTLNVAAAAAQREAKQMIFASTEWVYDHFTNDIAKTEDDPINAHALTSEYALSKYMAENALRLFYRDDGMDISILRFGIVYGPRRNNWSAVEALVHNVATTETITVGALATGRHFLHVSDVANGILAAVGTPGFEIFNIQGAQLISLGEIISEASRQLQHAPHIVERTPETPSLRRVSGKKAATHLSWQPHIDLTEGIASVINHLATTPEDL
ncbi:MAG: NAD(P)-dependent oxidoreductase [Rhodospirillaceae bacterium]|nr:NAD(P)-dependent oxidoreductase [Rhodospirillaceae bacterium]